jgi:hypothetical protein
MSFSRNLYDECSTKLHVERSVGEGNYRLFSGYVENPEECFSAYGPRGSKVDVSTAEKDITLKWGDMANIESDLTRRNVPLTNCNDSATNMDYYKNTTINKFECKPELTSEDTRFSFPLQSFRSLSTTSLQFTPHLYSNPQCHVIDDRIGLDSRNKVKDTFRTPKVKIVDRGQALPKENPNVPPLGYVMPTGQCN